MITLIGMGLGTPATLTAQGLAALQNADFITGAARLLERLPDGCTSNRRAAVRPAELLELVKPWRFPCVVYSGNIGFYSGKKLLVPRLKEAGWAVNILPGISSVQYFAAKLMRPWQDWLLESAHGVSCDPVAMVRQGRPVCFLTGGAEGPAALCRELAEAGLGDLPAVVGEDLSYPNEQIISGTAAEFAGRQFAPLNVLLVEPAPIKWEPVTTGIPDSEFIRGNVPMTKQEVRAAALAKLGICSGDTLWDVGAGTGSVSIEMGLLAKLGRVCAVELKPEAWPLIEENRAKFGAWNVELVKGAAPEALADLPAPDAVFVGGSAGNLADILRAVHEKNPRARVCVTAITVETLAEALRVLEGLGKTTQVTQLAVNRSKRAGHSHMLLAENPVYIITGDCHE